MRYRALLMVKSPAQIVAKEQAKAKREMLESEFAMQCRICKISVERQFRHPHSAYVWDFAIPACRLLIEINGGTWVKSGHSTGKGITRDYHKSNTAVMLGWNQLTFTADDLHSGDAINLVKKYIKLFPPF